MLTNCQSHYSCEAGTVAVNDGGYRKCVDILVLTPASFRNIVGHEGMLCRGAYERGTFIHVAGFVLIRLLSTIIRLTVHTVEVHCGR